MSKEKKEKTVIKENKVISFEFERVLLGLIFFLLCSIGLLGEGYLGNLITFGFVFLFGLLFYIPLLLFAYNLFFVVFKVKKPKIIKGYKIIFFITILVFILIAASWNYIDPSIKGTYIYFTNNFKAIISSKFLINRSLLALTGGGLIGNFLYALIYAVIGEIATKIFIILVIAISVFMLSKDLFIILFKNTSLSIKNSKLKKKQKAEKNFDDEFKKASIKQAKEEESLKKLTFDIFNEPLFETKKIIEKKAEEIKLKTYITINPDKSVLQEDNEFKSNQIDNTQLKEEINIEVEEEINEELNFDELDDQVKEENKTEEKLILEVEEDDIDVYDLLIENAQLNAAIELKEEASQNVNKINQKLIELNIKANVNNYIIGPCVTRYEIVPEIGVRVSSIVNIENDLKLALAAFQTRMEAPIPGKSAVGIEVANKKRYPVYLKEILYTYKDNENKLLVGIGKDLNNEGVVINIDKLPHLLIAGATGSGKSVCINSIIVSLLIRSKPKDVRFLLVDPKKVEMTCYADMPHLLCPIVKDAKKASFALKKVIIEMEDRYDLFAAAGVKNIDSYNTLMDKEDKDRKYKIVVIIDELADLMMVASKEVEESIQRLTQLARAAGIYLIIATQRPSVDVITGIIKANIPSRIAFGVSSSVDSRTIIDRNGAEQLLGKGDMLMDVSGTLGLNRVQGAFVSDEEINKIVKYVKSKYKLEYIDDFLELEEDSSSNTEILLESNTNEDLILYEEIKRSVIENQKASTSLLQKDFFLGYARASRMMDRLESEKIIGPQVGYKARDVLVEKESED